MLERYHPGAHLDDIFGHILQALPHQMEILSRPTSSTRIATCRTKTFLASPGSPLGVPKLGRYWPVLSYSVEG